MTTKLSSIARRSFCRGLAAMAVLPLAARCGAMRRPIRSARAKRVSSKFLALVSTMRPTAAAQSCS